ncbi:MAG TPA: TetR/AcrR family transcriptional regulator C-terminal domain-containing protein [Solirubrobacteraceae bacterium]|nr:TetR/AcrR family transcriptional regulator C-terminal domain-containing protein [Solirubrobacteraceae bacterium]
MSGTYEAELHAVDPTGLPDVEKDAVLTLDLGFVASAVRGAIESVQLEQQTGMTDAQWWAAHAPILARVMDGERYPLASRIGAAAGEAHNAASNPEHAFEFGLARVLDGIEAYVASR